MVVSSAWTLSKTPLNECKAGEAMFANGYCMIGSQSHRLNWSTT